MPFAHNACLHAADMQSCGAGDGLQQEEDGRRHSTRLRRPPLAWFRNEHKIYTRAHRGEL